MGLLNVDISKKRRLSLGGAKLPEAERRVDPPPLPVEKPPTDEEIAYSRLVAINPHLEELVESLDLVSTITGERIKKVELPEANRAPLKPLKTPAEAEAKREEKKPGNPRKGQKIEDIARRVLEPQSNKTKEEVIAKLMEETKVKEDRAEEGLTLMLKSGAVERITVNRVDRYYLSGSTPF